MVRLNVDKTNNWAAQTDFVSIEYLKLQPILF